MKGVICEDCKGLLRNWIEYAHAFLNGLEDQYNINETKSQRAILRALDLRFDLDATHPENI